MPLRPFQRFELPDGRRGETQCFVSVLGVVFDCSNDLAEFYGEGKAYAGFAGRDPSFALATMNLDKSCIDRFDYSLQGRNLQTLSEWMAYFVARYSIVGFLVDARHQCAIRSLLVVPPKKLGDTSYGGDPKQQERHEELWKIQQTMMASWRKKQDMKLKLVKAASEAVPFTLLLYFGAFAMEDGNQGPKFQLVLCVLKCLPIWLLALASFATPATSREHRLTNQCTSAGLVVSSVGDFILGLGGTELLGGVDNFLIGMVSFLIAHMLCIRVFMLDPRGQSLVFYGSDQIGPSLVVFYGSAIWLSNVLHEFIPPPLQIPACVYLLVTATMGHCSFVRTYAASEEVQRVGSSSQNSRWAAFLGAVSFMISGAVLACDKFYHPLSWAKGVIMATYFAGQFGIAGGSIMWAARPQEDPSGQCCAESEGEH
jgi:uncharacterized membrane protein YhhN